MPVHRDADSYKGTKSFLGCHLACYCKTRSDYVDTAVDCMRLKRRIITALSLSTSHLSNVEMSFSPLVYSFFPLLDTAWEFSLSFFLSEELYVWPYRADFDSCVYFSIYAVTDFNDDRFYDFTMTLDFHWDAVLPLQTISNGLMSYA